MSSSAEASLSGFRSLHRHAYRHVRDHFIPHERNNHHPHIVRHRALVLYSILLILLKVAVILSPVLLPSSVAVSAAITPENIVQLTNQSRSDMGLHTLVHNSELDEAAAAKAQDMLAQGYFAHFSPAGVSPWYWIKSAGYAYTYAGENLAIRFSTAEGVNAAWLASPAHRANIMSGNFSEIGVGVVSGQFQDQGEVTIVVQMFGTQEPASPQASPKKPQPVPALSARPASRPPLAPLPSTGETRLTFPFESAFVNRPDFEILGVSPDPSVVLTLDGKEYSILETQKGSFAYRIPQVQKLADGRHELSVAGKNEKGKLTAFSSVHFTVDTVGPEIYLERFSITPRLGQDKIFTVNAGIADDAIRAIVAAGEDSAVLQANGSDTWTGDLTVYHASGNPVPLQLSATDMAGNETASRVGMFSVGSVAGVYSFITEKPSAPIDFSVFGGLFHIHNFGAFVSNFYLWFVVFLAFSLALTVGIRRHVQHLPTIAASSAVMILAIVLSSI